MATTTKTATDAATTNTLTRHHHHHTTITANSTFNIKFRNSSDITTHLAVLAGATLIKIFKKSLRLCRFKLDRDEMLQKCSFSK